MKTIRVDEDVWKALQKKAIAFEDTPNSVLRRVFGLDRSKSRHNGRVRVPRGEKTPQRAFRSPILKALLEVDGVAKAADVLKRLEASIGGQLNSTDRQILSSGGIRWQNTAQWERNAMVVEGLLKKNSPRGLWELTSKGSSAAQANRLVGKG
jgi:hypothetical protein